MAILRWFNSNKRCFEICGSLLDCRGLKQLNSNKRCFEIEYASSIGASENSLMVTKDVLKKINRKMNKIKKGIIKKI